MNFVLKMEVKYALNAAGNVKYEKTGWNIILIKSQGCRDQNATRCSRGGHDHVLIDLNASEHLISFSERDQLSKSVFKRFQARF